MSIKEHYDPKVRAAYHHDSEQSIEKRYKSLVKGWAEEQRVGSKEYWCSAGEREKYRNNRYWRNKNAQINERRNATRAKNK